MCHRRLADTYSRPQFEWSESPLTLIINAESLTFRFASTGDDESIGIDSVIITGDALVPQLSPLPEPSAAALLSMAAFIIPFGWRRRHWGPHRRAQCHVSSLSCLIKLLHSDDSNNKRHAVRTLLCSAPPGALRPRHASATSCQCSHQRTQCTTPSLLTSYPGSTGASRLMQA